MRFGVGEDGICIQVDFPGDVHERMRMRVVMILLPVDGLDEQLDIHGVDPVLPREEGGDGVEIDGEFAYPEGAPTTPVPSGQRWPTSSGVCMVVESASHEISPRSKSRVASCGYLTKNLNGTICATAGAEALNYTLGTRTGIDVELDAQALAQHEHRRSAASELPCEIVAKAIRRGLGDRHAERGQSGDAHQ